MYSFSPGGRRDSKPGAAGGIMAFFFIVCVGTHVLVATVQSVISFSNYSKSLHLCKLQNFFGEF